MGIGSWWKRRRLDDDDFQDEIRAHLAIAVDERMADGADASTARLDSLKAFGNVTLTTESARDVWISRWAAALHDQLSDVRYAFRALAKNPVFALTVVAVLTLGIGLNAAVFTLVKSFVLAPLAGVDGSARLHVIVAETSSGRTLRLSYPDYQQLRDRNRAFVELFGSSLVTTNLGRGRDARQMSMELVTGNYFQALGVRAERGRTLLPSDELAPSRHPVVVISDGLWRRDFGADPDIVGKTLDINNYRLTIVGVADATFHGTIVGFDVEAFVPLTMTAEMGVYGGLSAATSSSVLSDRRAALVFPHGYLRPGVSFANAAAQVDAIGAALARDRALTETSQHLRLLTFTQSPTGGQTFITPTIAVLSGMGLLVLLIACANIAGLVLVRGMSRRGEIAMRMALGATRARIVRLLFVENLVLAVPAAFLGVWLAYREIPVIVDFTVKFAAPQRLFFNSQVDRLVIAFAVVVGCGSALLFGFLPALRGARVDLVSVINADATPRGAARGRLRSVLVVAQVAVSLLLLVCSGLVARSVDAARRANPGFDVTNVTAVAVDLKQNSYDEARGRVFYRHLLAAARGDAGIESATLAAFIPMGFQDTPARRIAVDGYEPRREDDMAFMYNVIGTDYFRTLRIVLIRGREFEDRDDPAGAPVAIVNETMAQRFWGSADKAMGKRIRVADGDWRTIVGVAADIKYSRINEPRRPYFYLPLQQSYRAGMTLHTRGTAAVATLVDQARARVAALDADLPILSARPLVERTDASLIFMNFTATMLWVFGTAGMALAAMGTYGLVSYTVRQRTHEIGIRMALGASQLAVIRSFLDGGLRLGASGAALGIVASLAVTRLLTTVLYGVSATDATAFLRALALVLTVVVVATFVPAWRAARTNPLSALRHQ